MKLLKMILIFSAVLLGSQAVAGPKEFLWGGYKPERCEKINPNGPNAEVHFDLTIKDAPNNPIFEYAECLADNKDRIGQYVLGMFYFNGFGTERDYEKALKYLKKAATKDFGQTTIFLPGVGSGTGTAVSAQVRPYSDGLPAAYMQLALMYGEGLGTKINEKRERQYLVLAAKQGNEEALEKLRVNFPEYYEELMAE